MSATALLPSTLMAPFWSLFIASHLAAYFNLLLLCILYFSSNLIISYEYSPNLVSSPVNKLSKTIVISYFILSLFSSFNSPVLWTWLHKSSIADISAASFHHFSLQIFLTTTKYQRQQDKPSTRRSNILPDCRAFVPLVGLQDLSNWQMPTTLVCGLHHSISFNWPYTDVPKPSGEVDAPESPTKKGQLNEPFRLHHILLTHCSSTCSFARARQQTICCSRDLWLQEVQQATQSPCLQRRWRYYCHQSCRHKCPWRSRLLWQIICFLFRGIQ